MNAVSKNLTVFFIFIIMFSIQGSIQGFLQNITLDKEANLYLPYLVYLPHGVRIIALITYGSIIIPGLYLAGLTTLFLRIGSIEEVMQFDFNLLITFGSPLMSIIAVWLAITLIYKKIKIEEYDIRIPLILKITFLSALLNAVLSNIFRYLFLADYQDLVNNIVFYFVGDSIGSLILFSFFALINRSLKD
ncbi:MAG: hypothetical protein VW739_05380 [Pelagibacteraceae bacterium]